MARPPAVSIGSGLPENNLAPPALPSCGHTVFRHNRLLRCHHGRRKHGGLVLRLSPAGRPRRLAPGKEMLRADLMPAATSDTTAPAANDFATIRPLSALLHRRRRPTPLRISTRPRGAEASTIWSTIYANRCHQQVRIFRTMPLAARWGQNTAYRPIALWGAKIAGRRQTSLGLGRAPLRPNQCAKASRHYRGIRSGEHWLPQSKLLFNRNISAAHGRRPRIRQHRCSCLGRGCWSAPSARRKRRPSRNRWSPPRPPQPWQGARAPRRWR